MKLKKGTAGILTVVLLLGMTAVLTWYGLGKLKERGLDREATLVMAECKTEEVSVPAFVTRPETIPWGECEPQKKGSGL